MSGSFLVFYWYASARPLLFEIQTAAPVHLSQCLPTARPSDPYEDQFAKLKEAKKERVSKNEARRQRNLAALGNTGARELKHNDIYIEREREREKKKEGEGEGERVCV